MLRSFRVNQMMAALVSLSMFCGSAAALDQPFAIIGGGIGPTGLPLPGQPPRNHWTVGVGTHLGFYTGDGGVKTDFAAPTSPTTIGGQFGSASPYVFRALNGHRLVTWYGRTEHGAAVPGEFQLTILGVNPDGSLIVEAYFLAEFVIDGSASTGRFRGASGSWMMHAFTEPFVLGSSDPLEYWWVGEGQIRLR